MKASSLFCLLTIISILSSCKKIENENSTLTTLAVNNITVNSAKGGGIIASDGSLPVLDHGVCWSFKQNPTISDSHSSEGIGDGSFTSSIVDLIGDSTYFVRAYYINVKDTVYGNQVEFTTPDYIVFNPNLAYGSVTDIDGNVYKTITIGTQTWMAENLRVTHFSNGDAIPYETDPLKWGTFEIRTSAYCWFKNDISKKDIYGAYYNWYATSDSRNIAPAGWHVATADEWQTLGNYCSRNYAFRDNYAFLLRETSTAHWGVSTFNPDATNETGFTALPCGMRANTPFGFINTGGSANFWTSTGTRDGSSAVDLRSTISITMMNYNCRGYNIRCIKD